MTDEGTDGDVMVAVEDPDQVTQLVRTAGDLARAGSGTVRLVTVVVKPYDSPFGIFEDETIVREFAADSHELLERATPPEGVEVVRDLVVARSVSRGIRTAVERSDPEALVIGWDADPRRRDVLLGTTVDAVLESVPTDVYVERIGREADGVESILLPVAGGPHVAVAARGAKAIARANDATVQLLSVVTDETGTDPAREYAAAAESALESAPGAAVSVETAVVQGERASDTIVEWAADHDVVVLGATRKGPIRGRLVGSVPRRVVRQSERTVVIARDGAVAGSLWYRLTSLLRR